jgi:hypothetical protein
MQLIPNAAQAPQMWSVRFMTLALAAEAAWKTAPAEVLAIIAVDWQGYITGALIVAAMIARVIKQELPQ